MSGSVHLVGAGPGDPELLTLRAARLISEADVVLIDRLVDRRVLTLARPGAEIIDVGKAPGEDHGYTQERIHHLMVSRAGAGRTVVRLKGGDPMVLGRGGEEVERLAAAGIEVSVTPGVSSVLAAASSGGFSLTFRGIASGFAVVSGAEASGVDWSRYATVDTLVILMGVASRARIAAELIGWGRPGSEPTVFVESASLPQQRVVRSNLGEVAAGGVEVANPAVWVTGEVVAASRAARLEQAV